MSTGCLIRKLVVVTVVSAVMGCSRAPVNRLQDAVNEIHSSTEDPLGKRWAGNIVTQDIRGNWAFVITEREDGGVGVGRCAIGKTQDGPKWKVASFSCYSRNGDALKRAWATVDGSITGKVPKSLKQEWETKWAEYLTAKGLADHTFLYCQSCTMPLDKPSLFGTDAAGGKSTDYCAQCYQRGKFIEPDITMHEMIERRVKQMVEQYGVGETEARQNLSEYMPKTKRWKTNSRTSR